jgi:CRISPR system Cascade subunit CasD
MPSLFTMRLAAPVASLSGARIDTASDSLPIPTRSMIAGIMGAALGVGYGQPNVLQKLQDTIRLAVVVHREGTITRDYQTVRMDSAHMTGPMWWHDGHRVGVMERKGEKPERSITGERPLTCDYDATVVVELLAGAPFTVEEILNALRRPAHPLGIGQRSCIPSQPIAGEPLDAPTLIDGVALVGAGTIYLPAECVATGGFGDLYVSIPAGRDWATRQHGGSDTYVVRALCIGWKRIVMFSIQMDIDVLAAARAVSLSHTARHHVDMLLKTIITEALGGPVVRPWSLHRETGPVATVIGYSAIPLAEIETRLGTALPAVRAAVKTIHGHALPPVEAGQKFRFSIRLCPTIRITPSKDGSRAHGEQDAFLVAIERGGKNIDRERVYTRYLIERISGAIVDRAKLTRFRLETITRPHRFLPSAKTIVEAHRRLGKTCRDGRCQLRRSAQRSARPCRENPAAA